MTTIFTTALTGRSIGSNLQLGGGSPPMPTDMQRATGAILTVRGIGYLASFPDRIRRIEITLGSRPAGVDHSSPEMRTKTSRTANARSCCEFISNLKTNLKTAVNLKQRFAKFLQASGGSPFKHKDMQRTNGSILTVRAIATGRAFPDRIRRIEMLYRWRPAGVDCSIPGIRSKIKAAAAASPPSLLFA